MELRNDEDFNETVVNNEELKIENDKAYFEEVKKSKETEFKKAHSSDGSGVFNPNDVRNGDLVSLLLAATPPYFYNVPMVPQTFFFSEMLKSFVQAKRERQNLKAQQNPSRRQRKRAWKEMTSPNTLPYEAKDKPLELTIPKQIDDKQKGGDKNGIKRYQWDKIFGNDKKYQNPKFESSNFSIEKLANSSITSESECQNGRSNNRDFAPPTPTMWYPFLYPPPPPYGIDPLHFFIDLRVGKLLEVESNAVPDEN